MELKELIDLYEICRTYRRFKQEPLSKDFLTTLVDTARKRTNARNGQPWHYYIVESKENVSAMQPLLHYAAALPKEIGTPKPGEQPVAFIVMTREKNANPFSLADAGIAFDTIALLAISQGVGTVLLGAIDRAKIQKLLQVPEDQEVILTIGLGYPAHKSTMVPVKADGNLDYYVDANRDYYVPKKALKDVMEYR
ncbi:MAG: nitroreductase family protein [Acidaminococcus sp.]|jgi:FMN reductase [NAD(P)H]|nr:nitroreductase family protein [Acidaminococcus sp.]MCI2115344.1 nitroreductase family protein [Acidaminococcus sp.]MCI2117395.1 nitroreductase family protein [Acidaminococcus sp.]